MTKVFIHCSSSIFGNASLITKWHISERHFSAIGYHYVILNGLLSPFKYHDYFNGHLETGRPLDDDDDMEMDEIGAHALGHNKSVGICLVGMSGNFTEPQIRTLSQLTGRLRKQFGEILVLQHSDVEPKKPGCAGLSKLQIASLNL